jgi:DNA repair photolyase
MRLIENPPNPYATSQCDWLEPPPEARVEVFEEEARSILSKNSSPDIPFTYSVNPYRGCQHACSYCYARTSHEYLGFGAGTDFDTRIVVKTNAAELLADAMARRSWRREPIAFSGVTDCYQPLEAVYRLTEQCLRVCHDYCNPVSIITKAYLIVRDCDLLTGIRDRARVRVYFSIPFAEDRVARCIETGAPPPSRRFEAMKRLADAGIKVGVMVAPIIPGLNDRDVATILKRAADCGARTAAYTPLRLVGSVDPVFRSRLRAALPDHAVRVETLLGEIHGGRTDDNRPGHRMRGQGEYWASVLQLFEKTARKCGIRVRRDEKDQESDARDNDEKARPTAVQLPLFG